jgi:uncharacterized protein (DUF302 family)
VVERTTTALQAQGFGILTTIDVAATLRQKLDVAFEPYVILGACHPQLAYRALQAEHEVGLLMPCNVVVHEHGERCVVSFLDPHIQLGVVAENAEIEAVAVEAGKALHRAADALETRTG